MVIAEWLEAVGYMGLKWPGQQLDEPIARAWFPGVARFPQADVMAAVDRLSWRMSFRPALADVVAETTLLLKERAPVMLPEPVPQSNDYGPAWLAVGAAVREGRLPRKELDVLAEKHKRWFLDNGEYARATPAMIAEVRALADRAGAEVAPLPPSFGPQSLRYSDAHKARYMAAVVAKEEQEKAQREAPRP
jgi:hypothetical protein